MARQQSQPSLEAFLLALVEVRNSDTASTRSIFNTAETSDCQTIFFNKKFLISLRPNLLKKLLSTCKIVVWQ